MEYAYYPGCSLHVMSSEYDVSMQAAFEKLGLTLVEVPLWFCCGASSAHMTDALLADALPAKNLALSTKIASTVIVPCAACFQRLKTTNYKLQNNPDYLKSINEKIKEEYQANVLVKHPLEIIRENYSPEQLKSLVLKPLSGLKVACYYGCLLVRPKEIAIDELENPQSLDNLVSLLGATAVEWAFKVECCGAGMTLAHKETVIGLAKKVLQDAINRGADCIAVACPMCQTNLDLYQHQMHLEREIPILYFTELLGLALGIDYEEMEIDKHIISAKNLLQKKGLI